MDFPCDRWFLILLVCTTPLGAQSTVVPADSIVATAPVGTLSELLNGRVPGLVVLPRDGTAGAGSNVVIRGETPPLLVIDGVRADNDRGGDNGAAAGHPAPGRFDDLSPDEIDHIEILPGAAASALYGPDAGNGVILVTTKHASTKARGLITTEGAQVSTPVDQPDNYYAWGHQGGAPTQCLTYLRASGQCTLDSVTHFNPVPQTLETVHQDRIGATIEGTSATQRLLISGNYLNDPGTWQMPSSDAAIYSREYGFAPARSHTLPNRQQQGDVRGSFGLDLAKAADLALTLGYTSRYQRNPSSNAILTHAAKGPGYSGTTDGWPDSLSRPWSDMADVARQNARHVNGGITINVQPSAVWATHITLGVDAIDQTAGDTSAEPASINNGEYAVGHDHTRLTQYTADAGVTLTEGGAAARSQTTLGLQYLAEHFHDSTYNAIGNPFAYATQEEQVHGSSQSRSAYAREVLTFADKLVLGAGARYDNQRLHGLRLASWTLNPSLDASLTFVGSAADPRFRIRGALGQTSSLPDARDMAPILDIGLTGYACAPIGVCFQVSPIRPERQRELEAGIDASLPNDRFTTSVTFYARRNVHELVPTATRLGPTNAPVPLLLPDALVTDRGVEFTIGAKLVDRPTFGWDASLDASENTNKMLRVSPLVEFSGFNAVHGAVGHPISGLWGTAYTYGDANHDGAIEPNELTMTGPLYGEYLGSTTPTHLASASTSIQIFNRKLRIATLFDYRGGYVLPNLELGAFASETMNARALNVPGASLHDQAAAQMSLYGNSVAAQRVSAVRWRELSATVGVPGPHTIQLTAAVRNLKLWTGYHGADPDWNISVPTASGFIPAQLPEPRTWLLRVTAGF